MYLFDLTNCLLMNEPSHWLLLKFFFFFLKESTLCPAGLSESVSSAEQFSRLCLFAQSDTSSAVMHSLGS